MLTVVIDRKTGQVISQTFKPSPDDLSQEEVGKILARLITEWWRDSGRMAADLQEEMDQ